jgi:hypothetical protein
LSGKDADLNSPRRLVSAVYGAVVVLIMEAQ